MSSLTSKTITTNSATNILKPPVLNIDAIAASLGDVLKHYDEVNASLKHKREPMSPIIVDNMVAAYARLDDFLADNIDLFQRENLTKILELNHIVLCGTDWESNREYLSYIHATQDHFFMSRQFNITELVRWQIRHHNDPIFKQAAGLYIGTLSWPQLFIEGNHRTGALIMSYVLSRNGEPPFVLTRKNAKQYFDPSSTIKSKHKSGYFTYFKMPKIKKKFGEFLEMQSDPLYLCENISDR